jgi:phosphate-selective porin OprO and OprP
MYRLTTLATSLLLLFCMPLQAEVPASDSGVDELREAVAEQGRQIQAQRALLDQQQAVISRLSTEDGDWLDARRAEEVKGLIREVLSDADTRASMLQDGLTAGHNGKSFFICSQDGAFALNIAGMIQFHHIYNSQDESGTDDEAAGFEVARTRFGFIGNVVDPTWKYVIWTGHSDTGSALLLDSYITKVFEGGWSVTAGQFKTPLWREFLVSEKSQQLIDRSLLNGLSGSYTQGVKADYKNDTVHITLSFNDGLAGINKTWSTEDTDLAFTGRGELLVFGNWTNYSSWMSCEHDEPVLVLGGAAHYQKGESGTATVPVDITRWTADVNWGMGGANLFAAIIGDHQESDTVEIDRLGVLVQAGVFVTEKLEVFGRYEWADLDTDVDGTDDLGIVTVGGNYYIQGHRLKISADVGYGVDPVPSTFSSNSAGWRTDTAGEDGQIVARTQVQLLF